MKKHIFENELLNNNFKIYHRVDLNKFYDDFRDTLRSVLTKGLLVHDNKEIGAAIWFSKDYNDYAKYGNFVLSIEYNQENKEKYKMVTQSSNVYVYESIPFKELTVEKIPIMILRNRRIVESDQIIDWFNEKDYDVIKKINMNDFIIYTDLFEKYVSPYIKEKNVLSQINIDKLTTLF